ncbi:hypothetical protein [Fusobacterium polymorphum]|uniref:hypothetical protein n=1 Tax=Fusobacterium nucleatum subsp. polymorphum TaxID=76857 RepID=UPI0030CD2017
MATKIFNLKTLTDIVSQTKKPKNFLYGLLVGQETAEKTQNLKYILEKLEEKKLL